MLKDAHVTSVSTDTMPADLRAESGIALHGDATVCAPGRKPMTVHFHVCEEGSVTVYDDKGNVLGIGTMLYTLTGDLYDAIERAMA